MVSTYCLLLVLIPLTYGEVFNRTLADNGVPGTCSSYPCTFNCDETSSCRNTLISCGNAIGGGVCTINLMGTYSGYQTSIGTGSATEIYINAAGVQSFYQGVLTANTVLSAKLYITVTGGQNAFYDADVYTPYGRGSEFSIICGTDATTYDCQRMKIYDDYTTKVSLYSYSPYGFYLSTVTPQPAITKSSNPNDTLYINYRASVTLYCSISDRGFQSFQYQGTDHGNWTIESHGSWGFLSSTLYADHSFITTDHYYINVIGRDETSAVGNPIIYASQNNGHYLLDMTAPYACTHSDGDHSASYFLQFIVDKSDYVLSELTAIGDSTWAFRYSRWTIDANISGDVIFKMDGNGGSRESQIRLNGRMGGDISFTDRGATGIGFYNSLISIPNGTDGDVLFLDQSIASGQVFRYNTITIGNIGGTLTAYEDSEYGVSFGGKTWNIGVVSGNVLFQAYNDNGLQAFDASTITIQQIGGNLQLFSNSYGSFSENTFTVNNGIGGDLTMVDVASGGYGFYNGFFNFYGVIGGSVSIRDQSVKTSGYSRMAYSTEWIFNTILGDMEFIERSTTGNAFAVSKFTIDYVGGNLLFSAENDNAYQAFDQCTYNIGTVNGNLSMYSNNVGAFSDSTVTIENVNQIARFTGIASGGNDFYHTDFNINGSDVIIFDVLGTQTLRLSTNYFGAQVNTLKLYIRGGVNALYQSNWDCRNCNNFELYCLNDADCGGVVNVETNIWCPINNANNKCLIQCDQNAQCDYIDAFTTNGYCSDAVFECNEIVTNDCNIDISRIFCTTGTSNNYGDVTTSYCTMEQDALNNNKWVCDNYGPSLCSVSNCSPQPTINPTLNPTINPTKQPTYNPTKQPTNNPSKQPTDNPTKQPTENPTPLPTNNPTPQPTDNPVAIGDPTKSPTDPTPAPSDIPTSIPSSNPSTVPTFTPSNNPSIVPTNIPSYTPTIIPSNNPSSIPSNIPSNIPSSIPSNIPSNIPSQRPTNHPSGNPTTTVSNTLTTPSPFGSGTASKTTETAENTNNGDSKQEESSVLLDSNQLLLVIIILIALLICVCIVLIIVFLRKKKDSNDNKMLHNVHELQKITSVSEMELGQMTSTPGDGRIATTHIAGDGPGDDGDTNEDDNDGDDMIHINANQPITPIPIQQQQNQALVPVIFDNDNALKMWLNNLNLIEYYDVFVEHGFNDQVSSLSEITDQDLKEMGLKKIGHRRAILKQVKLLKISNDAEGPQNNITNDGLGNDNHDAMYGRGNSNYTQSGNNTNNNNNNNKNSDSDSEQLY